jgi:hypothetical protein
MNIASTPAVQAATSATQSPSGDAVNIAVMKKALDSQAANAAGLIAAIPQAPALAVDGALGTQLNTWA